MTNRTTGAEAIASTTPVSPPRWRIWWRSLRVPSFSATVVPLSIGMAYAGFEGYVNLGLGVAMLVAATSCQAGANLANDYFDHRKGVDSFARPGSSTIIQSGLLTARQVLAGMMLAFVLATAIGFAIVATTGWSVFLLALGSLLLAVLYSAGPRPLAHLALGEVVVFLTMGLALCAGAYLVLVGTVTPDVLVISLPNAFIVTALLHVNNTRDVERDQAAGKVTLSQILGRRPSNRVLAMLLILAFLTLIFIVVRSPLLLPAALALLTILVARRINDAFRAAQSEASFTVVLRRLNRFQVEFGGLITLGVVIAAVWQHVT